jgi:hypothetical protein
MQRIGLRGARPHVLCPSPITLANITRNQPNTWSAVSYDPRSGEEHHIAITLLATGAKMEL